MREIKFRGKHIVSNEWMYGEFTPEKMCPTKLISCVGEYPCDPAENVRPETVGQYIGLKDKNGREIYEGDIVRWENRNTYPNVGVVRYWENQCKFACEAEYGAFELVECYAAGEHLSEYVYNTYEVIGNIYDNPELING